MNKLTNEEIARVFAMYLGSACLLEDGNISDKTTMISLSGQLMVDYNNIGSTEHEINYCKLLIKPLSKITDPHYVKLCKIYYPNLDNTVEDGRELISILYETKSAFERNDCFDIIYIYQYLIQQGYAVPLFFGINHWANGKTAIELEIAVDKTTLQNEK
jgi:hypothetical protein